MSKKAKYKVGDVVESSVGYIMGEADKAVVTKVEEPNKDGDRLYWAQPYTGGKKPSFEAEHRPDLSHWEHQMTLVD